MPATPCPIICFREAATGEDPVNDLFATVLRPLLDTLLALISIYNVDGLRRFADDLGAAIESAKLLAPAKWREQLITAAEDYFAISNSCARQLLLANAA